MEQRQQEKERFTKQQRQRPGKLTNLRETQDEAEDFRRQLKERSQAINVASLEERLGNKSVMRSSPQQQDFRHLLRPAKPTDHSRHDSKHKPAGGSGSREQMEWQRSQQRRVHKGPSSSLGGGGGGGRFDQREQASQVNRQLGYDHRPQRQREGGDHHPQRQREGGGRSNGASKTSHKVDIQHEDSDDRYYDYETQF